MGACKRGLKPQIFNDNWGEVRPGRLGFVGRIGAFSGLSGASCGRSEPHLTATGEEQELPEKGLFRLIGAFWAKREGRVVSAFRCPA